MATRSIIADITNLSSSSGIDSKVARSLVVAVANLSGSSGIDSKVARSLIAAVANLSGSSNIDQRITRFLVADITNLSSSSDIDQKLIRPLVADIINLSSSSDIDHRIIRSLVADITNLSSSSDIDIAGTNLLSGDIIFDITSDSVTKLSFLIRIPTAYFADLFGIFLLMGESLDLAVNSVADPSVMCETFDLKTGDGYNNRRSADIQTTVASSDVPNYAMDFVYNRVWIEPNPFNAEFIVANIMKDTLMWNAYLESALTLDDLAITGTGGVSIVGLAETDIFSPTEEIVFSTVLSLIGAPVVDNTVTFTFSNGDVVVFLVVGTRVMVFPYPPQTDTVYTETYSWLTSVLRKYNGKEQRIRNRLDPRITKEITTFPTTLFDQSTLNQLLSGWQPSLFGVPIWSEERKTKTAHSAGDSVITVDTDYAEFAVGWSAVIIDSLQNFEGLNIISVGGGFINLETGYSLANSYVAGATVVPIHLCSLQPNYERTTFVTGFSRNKLLFDYYPDTYEHPFTAFTQYKTYDVMEMRPAVSGGWTERSERLMYLLDPLTGVVDYQDRFGYPDETFPLSFNLNSRSKIWDFKGWLASLAGKAKPFWVPTWREDLTMVAVLPQTQTIMTIRNVGYSRLIKQNPYRSHIYLKHVNGSNYTAQIIDSEEISSTEETITLDTSWGFDINVGDFTLISFLNSVRLANDEVNIQYTDANEAVCSMSVMVIDVL